MRHGFTLIELSIVIVIIGLIVGSVMVGQTLVATAGINKIATDLQKYQTAMATFQGKYNCLAGDCANATTFFGTDNSGCPANRNTAHDTGTCNGDGDGLINGWSNGSTIPVENFFAWEDLSLAQLIPPIAVGYVQTPGTNYPSYKGSAYYIFPVISYLVPASGFSSTLGYNLMNANPTQVGWGGIFPASISANQLLMQIGAFSTGSDSLSGPGLSGMQAQELDQKIDDGKPLTGRVTALNSGSLSCITGLAYTSGGGSACVLYYMMK